MPAIVTVMRAPNVRLLTLNIESHLHTPWYALDCPEGRVEVHFRRGPEYCSIGGVP